jgi:RNA polymerase sigma factor (sigma-70 family)
MAMKSDGELLRDYAKTHSEEAFAELVSRHINLVYSAALRQVNSDAHLAQDVSQSVFADLARKAASLSGRELLTGWLYTSTRFAAAKAARTEHRRRAREQEAYVMRELLSEPPAEEDWPRLRPVLDAMMHELKEAEREAVLLRYFENRSLTEIASQLGLSEDAARKRAGRALDKLRTLLERRGINAAGTLASMISANAVQLAPTGLAAAVTSASLATTAGTGTTLAFLKIMSMTKPGLTALVLGVAATLLFQQHSRNILRHENQALRRQLMQLKTDNERLSERLTRSTRALKLSLPAPQVHARPLSPAPEAPSTGLIARMQRGETAPPLTPAQAEKYLGENRRSAASLLAAFRATGDKQLLNEAAEKYPNDPQVAFTAAYAPGVPPAERRHWLDAFKQSAPDNSLADYLSAADHFKAGNIDQAIQELGVASGKSGYQDYSWNFIESGQEAYRSAGYSEEEARIIPSMSLLLPQFLELKQVNEQMLNLAAAYRQAGDGSSAQAALQMDLMLGQRLTAPANASLLSQQVGLAIQSYALGQMEPNTSYGSDGQTVQDALNEVNQKRTTLTQFGEQLDQLYATISAPDWISYHDRWLAFGEENAMKWLVGKYGEKR